VFPGDKLAFGLRRASMSVLFDELALADSLVDILWFERHQRMMPQGAVVQWPKVFVSGSGGFSQKWRFADRHEHCDGTKWGFFFLYYVLKATRMRLVARAWH